MAIPKISIDCIINYCGPRIYKQGKEYLNTDAFFIRYKDQMQLSAFCEGFSVPSYRVSVSFDYLGIINSCCTCKDNITGPCKHISALLLTWHYHSQTFKSRIDFAKNLKSKNKDDLVKLVEKMVDSYQQDKSPICIA